MTLFKGTQSNRKKNKQASHWTTLQTFQTRDFEFQRRSKMALSFLRIPQKKSNPELLWQVYLILTLRCGEHARETKQTTVINTKLISIHVRRQQQITFSKQSKIKTIEKHDNVDSPKQPPFRRELFVVHSTTKKENKQTRWRRLPSAWQMQHRKGGARSEKYTLI